jgi:NAD(P)-dependent dehydrogenase (short-subunit alcohol dehydrogenase family)
MSPNKGSGTAVVVGVGAERGLGAALCRRFGAEGYHVLVAGRTPEKLAQVVKTIGAAGGSAEAITVDTTREDDVVRLFDRAISAGDGRAAANVVIFNAGNNRRIDFKELSAEQFEQFWRVGCFGGFLVGREARGAWRRSAAARSSSRALPRACEASQDLRTSPPRKQGCG